MVLFLRLLADCMYLPPALCVRFWIGHVKSFKRIDDNLGNDKSRVLLVVCRDDVPGRICGAGLAEAFLEGCHVLLPEFPFLEVRLAEFPVLLRFVDVCEKALSLLVF